AGACICIFQVRIAQLPLTIIVAGYSDKDAYIRAGKLLGRLSGILERSPGSLHHQPLLRIDSNSLSWRDFEEAIIESIYTVEKSSPLRVHLSGSHWIRIIEGFCIPSIARHLRDSVSALAQKIPELIQIFSAWKTAAHADNRNRLSFAI